MTIYVLKIKQLNVKRSKVSNIIKKTLDCKTKNKSDGVYFETSQLLSEVTRLLKARLTSGIVGWQHVSIEVVED